MADAPYEPFPDQLDVPPRGRGQIERDRTRNKEQTDRLERGATPADEQAPTTVQTSEGEGQSDDDLAMILFERRRDARTDLVDTASTDTGHLSLVVPGQLLVRDIPENLSDAAKAILESRHFREPEQGEFSAVCPELEGRVTVYVHTGGQGDDNRDQRNDDMREAVRGLDEAGTKVKASPTLVTALQRVIVKAAIGPAPTTVDADEAFRLAGFHAPSGEVVVAVIDTGIANVRRADGWLNEVPGGPGRIDPLDAFPVPGNGRLDFAAGHGTFAAGIVRMVDPEARIRVYQALDSDGFADENTIACTMIQAVKDGAHVLSLSFGMQTIDNKSSVALELALEEIDRFCSGHGRPLPAIVAAAGNFGNEEKVWPAAFERVVSVAALTAKDDDGAYHGADWSTRGEWVTCCCVGSGIVSTFVPGKEDPEFFALRSPAGPGSNPPVPDSYPDHGRGDSWAVWSGTSFAAPQIAGAISRLCRDGLDPLDAQKELLVHAERLHAYPKFGKAIVLLPGT
jgi:hypothetical protein